MPRLSLLLCLAAASMVLLTSPGRAADDGAVLSLISQWYQELRKGRAGRRLQLMAPGAELLPRRCPDRCGPQPRALSPLERIAYPHYLAERAQEFTYEVERLTVEATLARVDVWERGFDYAPALEKTTQSAADAVFILEKREGEGWKVLLYRSLVRAVRAKDKDAPLPDLAPAAPH